MENRKWIIIEKFRLENILSSWNITRKTNTCYSDRWRSVVFTKSIGRIEYYHHGGAILWFCGAYFRVHFLFRSQKSVSLWRHRSSRWQFVIQNIHLLNNCTTKSRNCTTVVVLFDPTNWFGGYHPAPSIGVEVQNNKQKQTNIIATIREEQNGKSKRERSIRERSQHRGCT